VSKKYIIWTLEGEIKLQIIAIENSLNDGINRWDQNKKQKLRIKFKNPRIINKIAKK
jgi:hypothetical protein